MTPRNKDTSKAMAEQSRILIMNSALELFATNGFHATSIRMIADKANISLGLIYNYFKSKDELLLAIIERGLAEIHQLIVSIRDVKPNQILELFVSKLFDLLQENVSFWRLYLAVLLNPESIQFTRQTNLVSFEHLISFFEETLVNNNSKDPIQSARIINTLLHGAFFQYTLNENMETLEAVKISVKNLVARD